MMRGPKGLAPLVPAARFVGSACLAYVIGAMLVQGGFLLPEDWTVTIGYSVASLGFGSALIGVLCAHPTGIVTRTLSSRLLKTFGKYSYGIYVVHLPIVILLMTPPGDYFELPAAAAYLLHLVVTIALSFAVALLSWYVIELPFLRLKSGFTDRQDAA
jgi:peptidoglycan/LPS O-acetylase OafA/YrhL